ncbi:ROK family transcriptional regulator [Clostridium botulinum]|uniref:ROK family transcriptional regulator n=1 Tax=Clostridium TaxID=1485 RepID=UPI000502D314|nr:MULTISPECIES: ROK family transcriptional regulator [Clostridium]AIY80835.1 ROK family protein [Clostridium botulinum 202F]KAI3347797.1 ROK family transcriptional regulator [Clostridium botulinum]KFX54017.1 ROK family transcriptional regulator [Clostridium botulinum]KFX57010.1 ROK family transcriptional regulator [Clostridium botulinum]KON14549.1 ROK family transcriptional regulator [Clostridium botulinum]
MLYEKTTNIEVKKYNKNTIYRFIYNSEKTSKQEIAKNLEVSLPTITQHLKSLLEDGLIIEDGEFESTGGRKAKAIMCVKDSRLAVGLDITKNHISIILIDLGGNILRNIRIEKRFENTAEYYKNVGNVLCEFIENSEFKNSKILGIGISIPGIVSADQKEITNSHVLQIKNVQCEELKKHIPYECIFCNDANAAGKAELWNDDSKKNIIYLSLSNSVGGAICYNEKMYFGDNERSGEFGHMIIIPNGKECYCGQKGCVDAYCSAKVLSDSAGGSLSNFFTLLNNKNKEQVEIWKEYINNLSIVINNLRMAFDCTIILGGYVGAYLDENIKEVKGIVSKHNTFGMDTKYLMACHYKLESSAVGAALLHIEKFMKQI